MQAIKFTKDDTRATRWLLDGVGTNPKRKALLGIHVEEDTGLSVSADGVQLRATHTPEPLTYMDGKSILFEKTPRVNGENVYVSDTKSKFPDWRDSVQPTGDPKFSILLDGEILASIVKDMGIVRLDFHGKSAPIEISATDKYAILMPCDSQYPHEGLTP